MSSERSLFLLNGLSIKSFNKTIKEMGFGTPIRIREYCNKGEYGEIHVTTEEGRKFIFVIRDRISGWSIVQITQGNIIRIYDFNKEFYLGSELINDCIANNHGYITATSYVDFGRLRTHRILEDGTALRIEITEKELGQQNTFGYFGEKSKNEMFYRYPTEAYYRFEDYFYNLTSPVDTHDVYEHLINFFGTEMCKYVHVIYYQPVKPNLDEQRDLYIDDDIILSEFNVDNGIINRYGTVEDNGVISVWNDGQWRYSKKNVLIACSIIGEKEPLRKEIIIKLEDVSDAVESYKSIDLKHVLERVSELQKQLE